MDYRKTLCDCYNTGKLDFSKGDKLETGLGTVSFVVTQEFKVVESSSGKQEVPLPRDCSGIFSPNNNVYKLIEDFIEGTLGLDIIQGMFKDRITGDEANYTLVDVLFENASFGGTQGWRFHANSVQKTSDSE